MRSWKNGLLVCAASMAAAMGCSDDGESSQPQQTQQGNMPGNAGSGGQSSMMAAAAGSGGSSSSRPENGSASPGVTPMVGGEAGGAAASAAGAGGEAPDAGNELAPADAGAEEPAAPDAEAPPVVEEPDPEPEPEPETVGFSDVFQLLLNECGNCHGANAPRPRFAQANDEAASFAATQAMSQGEPVSSRIVTRAVVEGSMPPACQGALGDPGCLSVEEGALLQAWLDQGAQP